MIGSGLYPCGTCRQACIEARKGTCCPACGARVAEVLRLVEAEEARRIERLVYERWLSIHHRDRLVGLRRMLTFEEFARRYLDRNRNPGGQSNCVRVDLIDVH